MFYRSSILSADSFRFYQSIMDEDRAIDITQLLSLNSVSQLRMTADLVRNIFSNDVYVEVMPDKLRVSVLQIDKFFIAFLQILHN